MIGSPPRLRMFAGPNGSGKTSLARSLAKEYSPQGLFHLRYFLNADELLLQLQSGVGFDFSACEIRLSKEQLISSMQAGGRLASDHPFFGAAHVSGPLLTAPADACDSYVAAAIVDVVREQLLAAGASFSFETVMSHRSKVEFFARARANAYRTYLYFVATESPQLNLHRIRNRTGLGGHDVPDEKVIERYARCLDLLREALAAADRAYLFDNSGVEPIWIAERTPEGGLELKVPEQTLPTWFQQYVR